MVPKGWTKTTFGEHIDLLNGFAFKSALYSDDESDIKLLRGDNIEPNKLRWRNVKRWSKDDYESLEKYHLKVNDFIIAMDRTWITAGLKVAEVKQEDLPCLLVQRVSRIRSLPTLCQDIIKHHFSSYRFEQYVKSVQTETAVPHISSTQINEFNLLLPPLQEQQKIAKILSTWDKAISTTERLIDNSTQQKKALMQQLLTGKKRLLDESGERFEDEWEEVKLEDICIINPRNSIMPEDGLVSFVPMEAVSEDAKLMKQEIKKYDDVSKGFTSFINEDVIVAKITPCFENGKGAFIDGLHNGIGFGSTEFHVLRAKKQNHARFIYYLSLTNDFRGRGQLNMQGSAGHKRVTTDYVKLYKFLVPPTYKEQQKIATVLTNADNEIELLEQQLADLQQEKKALMQVLLTGKKRVVI